MIPGAVGALLPQTQVVLFVVPDRWRIRRDDADPGFDTAYRVAVGDLDTAHRVVGVYMRCEDRYNVEYKVTITIYHNHHA